MSATFIMSAIPEGVIIPPGKVKETIEKTAGYIARNGNNFKNRLLSENESNDKFSFLKEDDPFYKYYEFCVQEYNANGGSSDNGVKYENTHASHSVDIANKERYIKELKFQEPEFMIDSSNINVKDLKIIKLTALQCAACFDEPNYDQFFESFQAYLTELSKYQFDFLNHEHRLNHIFLRYLDQFKWLINENKCGNVSLKSRINLIINHEDNYERNILDYCYLLAEKKFTHQRNLQIQKKQTEKQKLEYASVDWNDFKIVATIDFTDADRFSELPTPWKKNELIYRSIEQKNNAALLIEEAPPSYIPEEEENYQNDLNVVSKYDTADVAKKSIKIRSAGETRLKKQETAQKFIKSPITGELIAENRFELHMKMVLRDPKYEQERQNYMRKNHTYGSNLTEAEVFRNIKRLRGDDSYDSNQNSKKNRY